MSKVPTLTELTGTDVDADPAVVDLTDDRADDVFGALTSRTARRLLQRLCDGPACASDLASATDTSVQNVHYHLGRLRSAGVIDVVDTVYSSKGREMDLYAPAADPLVIVSGDEGTRERVVDALSKLLGAIGVLSLASVALQELVQRVFYPGGPTPVTGGSGEYAAPPLTNVPPPVGLYVFAVGLLTLLGWFGWRLCRS